MGLPMGATSTQLNWVMIENVAVVTLRRQVYLSMGANHASIRKPGG